MPDALTNFRYTGTVNPADGEKDAYGRLLYPYLPDEALIETINLAIKLKRPLLVTGEPGSGKTRLAPSIAYELWRSFPSEERQPNDFPYSIKQAGHEPERQPIYFPYYVKSTSHGMDVCYTYDYVGRLRDSQIISSPHLSSSEEWEETAKRSADASKYILLGALGQAFDFDKPSVVLIDEIDKAEADFANDLLVEFEEKSFLIKETGKRKTVHEGAEPIVIITSNDERQLPDAFLRRCLFYHIEFPRKERLKQIVKIRFRNVSDELADEAVKRFLEIRKGMFESRGDQGKKVSTSELLDWIDVLRDFPNDEALKAVNGRLPASILLKSWNDHRDYMHLLESKG